MTVAQRNEIVVHYSNKKGLRLGSGDIRMPGDSVPEARSWKQNVFNANLKMNRIQLRSDYDHMKANNEGKRDLTVNDHVSKESTEEHQEEQLQESVSDQEHQQEELSEREKVVNALESLSVPKLRKKAKEYGVTQQGKKDELIKKITSAIMKEE